MKNLKRTLSYSLYALLATVLFTSCDDYPHHTVVEGKQNMIIYKVERLDSPRDGDYRYAVTDATGQGWELRSFTKYNLGDTLRISK
jgi:hypothetical protein